MSRIILGITLFLLQYLSALAIDVPNIQEPVTDLAGILSPDQKAGLDSKLMSFRDTDSTQIAVVIIPSLEGESLEDFSIRVAEAWKGGQKGRDNGAILLISIKDRKVRIEVGYGLEEKLTDLQSGQIIRNEIAPHFRQGDYYGGIDAGVTAMIQTVRGMYQGDPETERRPSSRSSGLPLHLLIILLFPLLWVLSATGKWGGGIIGAGVGIAGMLFLHSIWPLLLIGGAAGGLLGIFLGSIVRAGAKSGRGPGGFGGPFFWGGGGSGFGGGSGWGGGGGGFSGGGGGFGGGGSSGSW